MKFKIETSKFAELLGDVQLPAAKVGVAGTSLVLVEAEAGEAAEDGVVKFTASDLDVTVTRTLKANIERPGMCAVHSRKLLAISRSLPSQVAEVRTNPDKSKLGIFSGTAKATLPTIPTDEFPAREVFSSGKEISLEEGVLHDCLSKVHYAAAKDGTRYICMGVCIQSDGESVKFVATDTKRVSVSETSHQGADSFKVVVPSRTVERLLKILPRSKEIAKITVYPSNIIFDWTGGRLESKLIEGEFPNYAPLVEQMESRARVVVDRDNLLNAVRRASGAGGGDKVVSVCLRAANLADKGSLGDSQGAIVVSLPESVEGTYSEVIPLDSAPEKESKVAFFSEYIIEPLSVSPSKTLVFRYGESGEICFFEDGERLLSIIATVREAT